MTVHLIKLAVGPENLSELAAWQEKRIRDMKRKRQTPELIHVTRHTPKRAEEVLDDGSLYWVIKGRTVARQKLLELRPMIKDGMKHCGLVYDPVLVRVQAYPHRAFQGWRYLKAVDAPPDIGPWSGAQESTNTLQRELAELGLI